jgi:hypothetical protein
MVMPLTATQRRGLRASHFIAAGIRTTAITVSQMTDGGVLRKDQATLEVELAVSLKIIPLTSANTKDRAAHSN